MNIFKIAKGTPEVVALDKLLQYNLSVAEYHVACQISTQEFCNGFTVRNIGTSIVVFMGDPLAPNESKAVGGNRGEVYVGRMDLRFINTGAQQNKALVTQKCYMNIPRNDNL